MPRPRMEVHCMLHVDYFVDDPLHGEVLFQRHFRMNRKLSMKIVMSIREFDDYFICKKDCTDIVGCSSIWWCTAALILGTGKAWCGAFASTKRLTPWCELGTPHTPVLCFRSIFCVLSGKMFPCSALHASASPAFTIDEAVVGPLLEAELSKLACPACYYPLVSSIDRHSAPAKSDSSLECSPCKAVYCKKDDYWDLTVSVGSAEYSESMPAITQLFRTRLVSFLYERGWRQKFRWGGFPGLEREFEMATTYLTPKTGGILVDASCGSGLFSRLFVKSELYSLVVALDYSENMLKQCNEFIKKENISDERLALVRADISRLPLVSGSVDAVHAGAAIHCWPSQLVLLRKLAESFALGVFSWHLLSYQTLLQQLFQS
uniref:Uncharacterized protein n=1 Tax=Avena sativa TaxID=4498 RepID=A0ACD5Y6L6_AVESA